MITSTITAIEIHDDDTHLANVTMFDEGAAEVSIKSVVNASSWHELSNAIFVALKSMNLTGDAQ